MRAREIRMAAGRGKKRRGRGKGGGKARGAERGKDSGGSDSGGGDCDSGGCEDGGGGGGQESNWIPILHPSSEKFKRGEEENVPANMRMYGNKKQRHGGEGELFNPMLKQSTIRKNVKKRIPLSVKK